MPAITLNQFIKGEAYYVGTDIPIDMMTLFLKDVCQKLTLKTYSFPEGVELISNSNGYILLNHTEKDYSIEEFRNQKNIIDGTDFNGRLNKGQVAVFAK